MQKARTAKGDAFVWVKYKNVNLFKFIWHYDHISLSYFVRSIFKLLQSMFNLQDIRKRNSKRTY